ncbi:hypothetical protein, partial [Escherichia coli]|uniref:hypothetical protein n=1 Tax=Escherichia coli TaxID=562 RepID=UPI003EDFAE86
SLRTAGGAVPASVKEYQYFNSLSPEQQKTYLRVRGRPDAGGDANHIALVVYSFVERISTSAVKLPTNRYRSAICQLHNILP